MIVPLLDAYWVAALSLLPLQAPGGAGGDDVSLKSHVVRMQRIANTMYLENKVHSTEAAGEAALETPVPWMGDTMTLSSELPS